MYNGFSDYFGLCLPTFMNWTSKEIAMFDFSVMELIDDENKIACKS